jgi:hypothetical protein
VGIVWAGSHKLNVMGCMTRQAQFVKRKKIKHKSRWKKGKINRKKEGKNEALMAIENHLWEDI